jgi:hypothetical protein
MDTITTSQISGEDKTIRLSIPVPKAGETYRVTVKVEEDDLNGKEHCWPEGYLERVIGGWQGEFHIESEGIAETREPL